jgi:hypothetical protein
MLTVAIIGGIWLVLVIACCAMAAYNNEDSSDEALQFAIVILTPITFLVFVVASIRQFNTNCKAAKVREQERILREREANKDIAKDFDKFLGEN